MAADLQQMLKDAETCADNIWWGAHDKKDWTAVSEKFIRQEEIIARYAGTKPNLPLAAENMILALQKYDGLTANMAKNTGNVNSTYLEILDILKTMYVNLGMASEAPKYGVSASHAIASSTASWWHNWAAAEVARKSSVNSYDSHMCNVFNNLSNEHKARFGFESIMSDVLAHQMQAAGLLSHSLGKAELSRTQLVVYYTTLFTFLSKKQG